MQKIKSTIFLILISCLVNAQTKDILTIKHLDSELGIKNVNVIIPELDTILITDTSGIVDLVGLNNFDTLIIKKFGYSAQTINSNIRTIILQKDTSIYSHDLELLDLKHRDGYSLILLNINGEKYWFKQKGSSLYLGNGKEIETGQEYSEIFTNHKIIKTVHVDAFNCLSKIKVRGENYANFITAIYYNPEIRKKKSDRIPSLFWYSKRKMKKDTKILKLEYGCLK